MKEVELDMELEEEAHVSAKIIASLKPLKFRSVSHISLSLDQNLQRFAKIQLASALLTRFGSRAQGTCIWGVYDGNREVFHPE